MPVTDFTTTIAKIDEAIIVIADRAHYHVCQIASPLDRAPEYAAMLRDLTQARELLEVAQERTGPARQAQRSAAIAHDFEALASRGNREE